MSTTKFKLIASFLVMVVFIGVGFSNAEEREAEYIALSDYFYPLELDNKWIYVGRDYDGKRAKTVVRVEEYIPVYVGDSFLDNAYSVYHAYVNRTGVHYDTWYEYMDYTDEHGIERHGFDDDPGEYEFRIIPPVTFPSQVRIGELIVGAGDAYENGQKTGTVRYKFRILRRAKVRVPAGIFEDCIMVVFIVRGVEEEPQVSLDWCAKGIGSVQYIVLSGSGAGHIRRLLSASVLEIVTPD